MATRISSQSKLARMHQDALGNATCNIAKLDDASVVECIESETWINTTTLEESLDESYSITSPLNGFDQRNQQYSIYAVTNSSGAVQERYAYTAYGQPTFLNASGSQISNSTISNRYTYTGREWDQTIGLYYFRARWMSGNSGRFIGRDPIGYLDGFGLYCAKLSLKWVDPNGMYIQDALGNWCCEGDHAPACFVEIVVRAPCRSVYEQVAANLAALRSPNEGVESGHAWINLQCNGGIRYDLGFWPKPSDMSGPGIVRPEGEIAKDFPPTYVETLRTNGLCKSTVDCIKDGMLQPPPNFCLIDGGKNGPANCATWVVDRFRNCGFKGLGLIVEPFDLARRPGMKKIGNCYPDNAGAVHEEGEKE